MTPSLLSHQIADLLATGLTSAFDTLCTQRYGGPLSFHQRPSARPATPTLTFRLERLPHPPMEVELHVCHVGGNMYDVEARVENGPTQSFAYCLPDPMPLVGAKIPHVARAIVSFLLNTLERRLGSELLRRELQETPPSSRRARPLRGEITHGKRRRRH